MEKDILISGRNLRRHYRRGSETVKALDGVDVDVRAGESVCVLGPSGSGKTTLVNLLSALDAPTAGELTIGGRRVDGLSERELVGVRRGLLGYVFQQFHLIPTLTVAENVALPLLFLGRKAEPAEIARVLDAVGLADRAGHLPKELSGGQMQRVAIGRALANEPALILADEPTAALDTERGTKVMAMLRKIARERRSAVIAVTHDHRMIAGFDTVCHLDDGRLTQVERSAEGAEPG